MVIFDLVLFPDLDLDVHGFIWCFMTKVEKLKVWKVHRFDRELTLLISGSDCSFRGWNRFVVSCNNSTGRFELLHFALQFSGMTSLVWCIMTYVNRRFWFSG